MIILSFLFSFINYYTIINGILIRPLLINICYVIIIYLTYDVKISKVIVSTLLISILLSISELIFVNVFLKTSILDQQFSIYHAGGILLTNAIILLIGILLFYFPKIKNFFRWIIKWYSSKRIMNDIVMSAILVVGIGIISYQNFGNDITKSYMLTINTFLVIVILLTIVYFKQKVCNMKLEIEYDRLLEYVETYEVLLSEKMKTLHEYKNQLILIRGMVSPDNKEAIDYIDKLLNIREVTIENECLNKLSNIPQKGLKGFIYYKISKMQENGIEVIVDVSKELHQERLWNTCDKYLNDVSRIIGVYIDNAIEAAKEASKKYIIIDIEMENEGILFSFSNTYRGKIDMDKMDMEGFSTKGKGKGFGLSLVKDILLRNKVLMNQREIHGIYYVQKLLVKDEAV